MKKEGIEELTRLVGGRFKLSALLQKRVRELTMGSPPLIEKAHRDPVMTAIEELRAGKIELGPIIEDLGPEIYDDVVQSSDDD
ncbi:MAG: DNA-directed RNA polymerase subunit omega [Planctomycetes bacterium]|nr:DNA-directed RNA polymerase subunit omega [Planctomycetota bacterium]MBI3844893.1 DNA-directed RNA polymerase subunit omega [Planctomycetota bacterium]